MKQEKKELLEKMRAVKETAIEDLKNEPGQSMSLIQNVRYIGEVGLIHKETGEPKSHELYLVEEYNYVTDNIKQRIYLDGRPLKQEELLRDYEDIQPIKDSLEKINKTKEGRDEHTEDSFKIYDLNEMEREEYLEVAETEKDDVKQIAEFKEAKQEKTVEEEKLQSVQVKQELKGNTRVSNYETLSSALNMEDVKKYVVVYSEEAAKISIDKSRNSSKYSLLAVKTDGTIVNLDDKVEQSRSEGSNSTEGRIQTDADGSTQKEYHQASIYSIKGTNKALSIEHGNYGELQVYYGSMTKGAYENEGNQFVGTQLETRSVWPTTREVREQEDYSKGVYHADNKVKEAEKHFEHGDEKIKDIKDADGNTQTIGSCKQLNEKMLDEYVEDLMRNEFIADSFTAKEIKEAFLHEIEKDPEKEAELVKKIVEADLERVAPPERKR